jgi:hypothetical protein
VPRLLLAGWLGTRKVNNDYYALVLSFGFEFEFNFWVSVFDVIMEGAFSTGDFAFTLIDGRL